MKRLSSKYSFIVFLIIMMTINTGNIFSQQVLEIDEIEFEHKGKQSFDDDQLEDQIGITKAKAYNKNIVAEDIIKLKMFYFDNGFFDSSVDTSVSVNYEDDEASVTFIITEKTRYKIDSVTVMGLDKIPNETSNKIKKIKTLNNEYYSKALILQYINLIIDSLQNNGFMKTQLDLDTGTVITRYKENATVNVKIKLNGTDTIFYFGKTDIQINENVYGLRTEIPREEIVYKEGEIYSKIKMLESERNMSKIPIISNAKLNPGTISGNRVNFTAMINLNKKNELTPFIKGSNFENRFYAGAGIRYLNKYFLSSNKTLTLELEEDFHSPDINKTEFSAAITVPYFISRRITFIDKITIGFNNVENYKNYFAANVTTLNYFIASHTFYNNAYLDLSEELVWIKFDTIQTGRQTLLNSLLSLTLEHDNTNNLFSPSRGFYHSIMAGTSGLLPQVISGILAKNIFFSQFFKTYTLNKFYFNISRKPDNTVFAANIKIGDIIEYGRGEHIIPVQPLHKFFSGGSSSLRGWGAKENGILENTVNGGTFLFEGGFEIRKKLFPADAGFKKNIGAVFFIDYGNVWETHKDFRFSQFAYAIGLGVRYDLFVGPVRVDFGFKLYDPQAADDNKWLFSRKARIIIDKFTLHFGIGHAF